MRVYSLLQALFVKASELLTVTVPGVFSKIVPPAVIKPAAFVAANGNVAVQLTLIVGGQVTTGGVTSIITV